MTKDLALITTIENPTVLNSEGFIKAIRKEIVKENRKRVKILTLDFLPRFYYPG